MKLYPVTLRACAALACALALAACGGGSGQIKLGGTIAGLTTDGLVLSNGYTSMTVKANATAFTFPVELPSNNLYTVAVAAQPTDLTCTVTNGEGYTGRDDINNVQIECKQTAFKLGGAVNGLRTSGLTIANGSVTLDIPANATTFVFPSKVQATRSYGITVLKQPAGQTCDIVHGADVQPAADNSSVVINCN